MNEELTDEERRKCFYCKEPATIVVLMDRRDPETGHQEECPVCDEHYAMLEANS